MMNFLHTYKPDPVIISVGSVSIYWYSLLIIVAVILGFLIVAKLGKNYQISKDQVIDLGFYLIIFGILGARLYHVLLEIKYYSQYPLNIFKIWQGGLAIHGAIIAGIIVLIVYVRKNKQSFWLWADLIAPVIALGQSIGRWGNYFNSEIFGIPTSLPWGIPIDKTNRVAPYFSQQYFHPTFLYESALDFLVFLILIMLHQKKNKSGIKDGNIFLIYLISYSVIRFFMEFIRIDPTPIFLSLRMPQVVSLIIIIFSLLLIFYPQLKAVKK